MIDIPICWELRKSKTTFLLNSVYCLVEFYLLYSNPNYLGQSKEELARPSSYPQH